MTVYGIDFSGARDAARRTWIARIDGGAITWVKREAELGEPLVQFLASAGCVVGIDAPLSLPAELMDGGWEHWARGFSESFRNADAFRADCQQRSANEKKRAVEREAKVPFASWNLRLYRQTWRVMSELVSPLLGEGRHVVAPQQAPRPGATTLIEVCPASTLQHLGLRVPYKGPGAQLWAAREELARAFEAPALVVDDPGGDALDSVIAARVAAQALRAGDWHEPVPGEGRIYY
ncbi:MAG: DUF429 domain-containing protein [Acidobacteria bacterium]|nr:DUF429 domain-containing protein [Acidobacteriota bacterium]